MPYTTQVPLTFSYGCGTWLWVPRIRSMSGRPSAPREAVSVRARSSCCWSGAVCHSEPQWTLRTTTFAPAARAARASAMIRAGSIRFTAQGLPSGSGMPFVPYV